MSTNMYTMSSIPYIFNSCSSDKCSSEVPMGRYIIRRLLQAIPLLFLLTIFMFTLIHLLPGGPEQVLFNPHLNAAGRAILRAHFGLDDPVPIQYLKWISRA